MYEEYQTDDFLISPANGRKIKQIMKKNIKSFGFESLEELEKLYPGFPTACKKLRESRSKKYKNEMKALKNLSITGRKKQSKNIRDQYYENPKLCLKCNTIISYEYKNNKYCSRQCNSRKYLTDERILELDYEILEKQNRIDNSPIEYKIEIKCSFCNNKLIRYKRNIQNSDYLPTCSSKVCKQKLGSINGRKSTQKMNRRSKQEIELFELCERYFKNVLSNYKIVDGWDADIFLPDYNIAILWNGPWHYKQMPHKNHSLSQVVNRDIIKIIEFEKNGIETLVYEDQHFNPLEAFVDIILKSNLF